MERQIATLDTNGHLALPDAVRAALDVHPGAQFEVSVIDRQLFLEPLDDNPILDDDPIEAVRGMFGPNSSLGDDLIELRAAEK